MMSFLSANWQAVLTALVLIAWVGVLIVLGVVDLYLGFRGLLTISQFVWKHPLAGVPVVMWAASGALFLAGHFWLGWLRP